MLEVNQLKMSYGEREIIKDLSFQIERHTITSIIGPNGCGKSTLLRGLSKNKKILQGEIKIDGQKIERYTTKNLAKKMAILPQAPTAPEDVTVGELISYGRFPYLDWTGRMKKQDYEKVEEILQEVGLEKFKNRKVMTLSGGERQIAWIAMALAQEPEILLLDEPTTYLDISHQYQVLEMIKKLNQEKNLTVVMVLHDLNQAVRYSERLLVLQEGDKYQEGVATEVLSEKTLWDVFKVKGTIQKYKGYPYFMLD